MSIFDLLSINWVTLLPGSCVSGVYLSIDVDLIRSWNK